MITELKVSAIDNGTVIDHIPSKSVFTVIKILNLEDEENQILFGTNLESKKYGTKGIIKIKNRYFKETEINKIALVAPIATIIVIKDYCVVEKKHVSIPNKVFKTIKCINPNCITNFENVDQQFDVVDKKDVILRCHYCEKITDKKNMNFI